MCFEWNNDEDATKRKDQRVSSFERINLDFDDFVRLFFSLVNVIFYLMQFRFSIFYLIRKKDIEIGME